MFGTKRRGSNRDSSQEPIGGYARRSRRSKKQAQVSPVLPLGGRRSSKKRSVTPSRAANTQPPVLARSTSTAAPSTVTRHSKRSVKSRRRFDVALGVPGAEVRLPALPVFRPGWHYLSGLLAVALLGLLYYIWTAPFLRVEFVEVQGLQRVSLADVNTVVGIHGDPVFLIDPEETRANLQAAFPEMSAITVEVRLPASMLVQVQERVPVLAWQKEGQELWVDAEGFTFAPRGEARPERVIEGDLPLFDAPQVESEDQDQQATPQVELEGLVLSEDQKVEAGGQAAAPRLDPQWVSAILVVGAQAPRRARLIYDGERGLGWEDRQGRQVFFGTSGVDPQTLDLKLKIYVALLQRLAKQEIRPALVSVEYVNAPYYRVER